MKNFLRQAVEGVVRRVDSATGNNLLLSLLNQQIREFGEMTSITIDAKTKSIACEVTLKGEDHPISIRITDYEIEPDGEGSLLTIGAISCSREWMDAVARKLLTRRQLPIPLSSELLKQIL